MSMSDGRSRAELIASYMADAFATPPPPPPAADKTPPPAAEKQPPEAEKPEQGSDAQASGDAAVTQALAEVKAAVDKAIQAQSGDPDNDTDPKDKAVVTGLNQLSEQVAKLIQAQAEDAGQPTEVTAAAPPAPEASPVAENGDIADDAKCANPDCGHLASSHVDTPDGANTGACSMSNCQCQAMEVDTDAGSQPNTGNGDSGAQSDTGGPADDGVSLAGPVAEPVMVPGTPEPDLNKPPAVPGGENVGPAFTIPVGVIEGQPTGDGREIAPDALSWRTPPMPLMGLATATHDPNGFDMNDPAVICGRIDSLERQPGEGGTQVIVAKGYYLANDDGQYWADLNEQMGRLGVSADVATEETDMEVGEVDQMGFPTEMTMTVTKGTIMGFTVCPFPAFEGCYVVLGDGSDSPDAKAIPQQADEPPTAEKPPAAVTAGGQLIHWMTYEDCGCGPEATLIASAAPTRPPKSWFEDPCFTVGDGRLVEILDRRGQRVVGGKYACPLTVTEDGRVYGHIAPWGVCHTGFPGNQCILAPKSGANYAHFKRAQHVLTAEGDTVRVGVITMDTGHAPTRGISAASAMAHYDNTALAAADVSIGEDEHGIWVAGALRPDVTEEQARKLRASSISGDWRKMGGGLELVAALAVNQPGFPLVQISDGPAAMVATGATIMDRLKHPAVEPDGPEGDVMLRRALAPMLGDARERARNQMSRQSARARLRVVR